LKAKELTLDSLSKSASPSSSAHKVMDHLGHQSKAGLTQGGHAMDSIAHKTTPHSVAYQHRPAVSAQTPVSGAGRGIPAASDANMGTTSGASTNDAATTETGTDQLANSGDNPATATDAPPATYTIRGGDCLWNIAKDHLGSGLRWQEIYKMNQDVLGQNPDLIYSGTDLKLPGVGSDLAHAGKAGEYVVKSGDCLWNVAKDQLGDATKWNELYKANADMIANPRLIFPGQHLTIPGHETAVADASAAGADQVVDASGAAGQAAPQATSAAAGSMPSATDAGTAAAPQGTVDGATSQQIESGAEMQAPAPVQQPAPMQPAPVQPAPTQIPGVVGPGAAGATGTVSLGPGAAGAATAHLEPLNPGTGDVLRPQPSTTVVNSSIGADLATFLSKRK
ncbi:MAG: LysM peptidoglycan-binding domain-containing protein, partial [Terriglobales bacterium]